MALGDSKTVRGTWPEVLAAELSASWAGGMQWSASKFGVNGGTVAGAAAKINETLALTPDWVPVDNLLINLGTNDNLNYVMPDEAQWKADYLTILDAYHARWPNGRAWMMRPWYVGNDVQAAIFKAWIADIQALRPTFTSLGPDEAVWLKNGDNGAAETLDGVHYTPLGESLCVAAWKASLGY